MQHLKPFTVMDDERGFLKEVHQGEWAQLNHMTIKKGQVRGNHYHKKLKELFYVISGKVKFDVKHVETGKEESFVLEPGQAVMIEPLDYHVVTAIEDVMMVSLYSEKFDPGDLHPLDS